MEEKIENEGVETVELQSAIEKVRAASVFAGHPADGTEFKSEDEDEDHGSDATDDTDEEDEDQSDESVKQQDDAKEKASKKEEAPIKKKYASHEEAEKGAKEAERRMHEAIEEAKRMRQEVEEIRKKLEEQTKTGELTQKEGKEIDSLFKEMLKTIKDLDADDPDYDETLANVWAKTISSVTEATAKKIIAQEESKRIEAEKRNEYVRFVEKKATEAAKQAGLDMETEQSPDYELFWTISQQAVGETLEERIDWTVNKVKSLKSSIAGKTVEAQKKTKQAQAKNKVLERGLTKPTSNDSDEDDSPIGIMEALARVKRRV